MQIKLFYADLIKFCIFAVETNNKIIMNIRDNVKRLCVLQGITQKQLSEKIGISDSNLNITLGRTDPHFSSLKRIADALGVTVDVLTSEDIEKHIAATSQEQEQRNPQQGLYCPHCGKPLTLFIKAEGTESQEQ